MKSPLLLACCTCFALLLLSCHSSSVQVEQAPFRSFYDTLDCFRYEGAYKDSLFQHLMAEDVFYAKALQISDSLRASMAYPETCIFYFVYSEHYQQLSYRLLLADHKKVHIYKSDGAYIHESMLLPSPEMKSFDVNRPLYDYSSVQKACIYKFCAPLMYQHRAVFLIYDRSELKLMYLLNGKQHAFFDNFLSGDIQRVMLEAHKELYAYE